jgi:amphi-Trp domain-containing protein
MARDKRLIQVKGTRSHAETAAFLHQLADWLGEGKLILGEGEDAQVLALPDELEMEFQVDAKKKGKRKKYSLEIELEWVERKVAEIKEYPGEAPEGDPESVAPAT